MGFTFMTDDASIYYDYDKECYMSGDGRMCFPVSEKKKKEMRKARKKLDEAIKKLVEAIRKETK